MKSKALKISVFLLFCAAFAAFGRQGRPVRANSDGPPASRTGAPNEQTCAIAACHVGTPINTGGGTLTVAGFPTNYSPNQEADITVTISQANRIRFGFQATIIDDQGRAAGTITATEPSRTFVISSPVGANLRQYIQHSLNGNTANGGANQGRWTFRWKAPAQSVGRIRIFVAANAANNNGSADSGDLIYTTNLSSQPAVVVPAVATVSAASFASNVALAPEMIVSGFGSGLSVNVVIANTTPLPTELDGTQVIVRDANNVDRNAPLFFVAPSQINYLIPAGTATGAATISVRRGGNTVAQGNVTIDTISPGIFTANASGQGVPAATILRVINGQLVYDSIFTSQNGQVTPIPIDLTLQNNTDVYLILYGTGVKGAAANAVTATIGGTATPILGFAAAPGFVGLDQINVGPIPRSLIGRGNVDVVLTVGGKPANTVSVNIK
ncbi:MAG TPA: hypothetical protein PLD20_17045 [Blastocatellia bacterium]|nr:hypothetical protein [Blastocatellia bacterium]HMV84674.1 hypothetical protein [Blastocatellia bacterium]HMX25494.1 hypothetical protein [Blastocatellia bacterium]HMZ19645.1 hypothetical protein [Blastocatellia bacterium]HNG28985.1 hypothetical protein [Blastocatellia bacterium]